MSSVPRCLFYVSPVVSLRVSHAGRGQVRVFVLETSVQSDPPPLLVVAQERIQGVVLLQTRPRGDQVTETTTTIQS